MILENHIRGRRRLLDDAKKARLCELIDQESYSVEQAAESLDVSLRTVQRERRHDQDFDHEVRLALQSTPDPLKLMEHAARTHWRAAAWLLERTKPEEFARKPVNMTSLKLVATAFRYLQEAALETVPEQYHEALYRHTQQAIEQSFDCCFPMRGKWGEPKVKKLPFETPLADVQWRTVSRENEGVLHDRDEQGNVILPPPVDLAEVAARQAKEAAFQAQKAELKKRLAERRRQEAIGQWPAEGILSPKTSAATKSTAATETAAPDDKLAATQSGALPPADGILSPKTPETTKVDGATKVDGDNIPRRRLHQRRRRDDRAEDRRRVPRDLERYRRTRSSRCARSQNPPAAPQRTPRASPPPRATPSTRRREESQSRQKAR